MFHIISAGNYTKSTGFPQLVFSVQLKRTMLSELRILRLVAHTHRGTDYRLKTPTGQIWENRSLHLGEYGSRNYNP